MSIQLREYQESLIGGIRAAFTTRRRVLGVAPTGAGKTLMFSYISAGVARNGKRVTILAHRDFLLDQISDALKQFNIPHGILVGGQIGIPRAPVVVASVFTLAKRLRHYPAPDLIIGDEAHHFTPESSWGKVLDAFPQARCLGVTATPQRLDGRGLGEMFDDMVVGPTTAELIALGYLVPYELYGTAAAPDLSGVKRRAGDYAVGELEAAMDKPVITGSAVDHYLRLARGKRGVAFCVSIKHAEDVAAQFRSAGISARTVNGKMERSDLRRIMRAFAAGEIQVLTACDLISEGYDLPAIEAAILLRPTKSLGLYLQQVGRGLRPSPSKDRLIILDHAGLTKEHGYPDDDREWSLEGGAAQKQNGERVARVSTCPVCFAMHRPAPVCPRCAHVYEVKGRKIEQVDGELVRVVGGEVVVSEADAATKELERQYYILVKIARGRGYTNPEKWAFDVISSKLASKLAKTREPSGPTTNGLTTEELDELKRRTVMKAMSKEDPVGMVA